MHRVAGSSEEREKAFMYSLEGPRDEKENKKERIISTLFKAQFAQEMTFRQ